MQGVVPAKLSTVPVTVVRYSVCASKAIYSSCHNTALQCVCQHSSLQFVSPYFIAVCVPARLSTVPVTILHYSLCASKALYISCPHTSLLCVCQQSSLQFVSPYFIAVCERARLSTVPVTILHYSLCASKALYISCHHTSLLCVCQQSSLHFVSPYSIAVCVPARLSTVPVTILHYSLCASKAL